MPSSLHRHCGWKPTGPQAGGLRGLALSGDLKPCAVAGSGREVAGRWPGGGLRRATPTRSPAPALRALRRLPRSLCRHGRGLGRRRQRRESGGVTRAALRPCSVREALLPRGREGSDLSSPQRDLRDLRCADRAGPLRPAQRRGHRRAQVPGLPGLAVPASGGYFQPRAISSQR